MLNSRLHVDRATCVKCLYVLQIFWLNCFLFFVFLLLSFEHVICYILYFIFQMLVICWICGSKIFSSALWLVFSCCSHNHSMKIFTFGDVHSVFLLEGHAFGGKSKNTAPRSVFQRFSPMSSKRFVVLYFAFKKMIYYFIFDCAEFLLLLTWAFSSHSEWGLLFVEVPRLLLVMVFLLWSTSSRVHTLQ